MTTAEREREGGRERARERGGRERGGGREREGGRYRRSQFCPVTIAQPRSSAEELLAMQIDTQGGGNNLDWKKKTLKRHFPHFSHQYCYIANKLLREINSSKAVKTLQSPVFPWRTRVSFHSRLRLWSWLRIGGGLTYLPMQILFVTVCEAKSFGSHFF